jgi:hypothetical protein
MTRSLLCLSVAGALAGGAVHAQRAPEPHNGVCFYEHDNYEGRSFCARVGASAPMVPPGTNDQVSSLRVFGNAQVTVYKDGSYRGASRVIDTDIPSLRRIGWNDRISSYRVARGGPLGGGSGWGSTAGGGFAWGRPSRPSSGVCFYQHPNFRGDYFCARPGTDARDVPSGTNDRISSIAVFGDAEVVVYKDASFLGASRRFTGDAPDLGADGWNDRISSFRVETRFTRGNGRTRVPTYAEAQEIVRRAYLNVFNREPDPAAAGWVTAVIKNNWNQAQLEAQLRKRSPSTTGR